jgi:hypothetical protein
MMNSNNMDAAQHQKLMQMQQLASNAKQTAITNETQGRVAMEGAQRVAGLSAAQEKANQGKTLGIYALKGADSETKKYADPNFKEDVGRSLGEQSRLRAMMA